jgi:hypothetical protein
MGQQRPDRVMIKESQADKERKPQLSGLSDSYKIGR